MATKTEKAVIPWGVQNCSKNYLSFFPPLLLSPGVFHGLCANAAVAER